MTLDQDIELIGFPEQGEFKVVQLFLNNSPIMLFGHNNLKHSDVLETYLKEKGVNPEKVSTGNQIGKVVAIKGENYEVVGMGKCTVYYYQKIIRPPNGRSVDYAKVIEGTNLAFNERFRSQLKDWRFI